MGGHGKKVEMAIIESYQLDLYNDRVESGSGVTLWAYVEYSAKRLPPGNHLYLTSIWAGVGAIDSWINGQ